MLSLTASILPRQGYLLPSNIPHFSICKAIYQMRMSVSIYLILAIITIALLTQSAGKRSNKPHFGFNSEDLADYELRTVYQNFSIDHVLQDRIIAPNNDMDGVVSKFDNIMGKGWGSKIAPSSLPPISGGKMPMLTRKGFVDITTVETLGEPSTGWMRINRMARSYRLAGPWSQWGDCPREMVPDVAPKALLDRIARIAEFSRRQAAQRIEANRVKLALKQQGEQNALDLLDPPGTRYYYRY
jgi:hypothetical protein